MLEKSGSEDCVFCHFCVKIKDLKSIPSSFLFSAIFFRHRTCRVLYVHGLWEGNEIQHFMLNKAYPSVLEGKNNLPENFKMVFFPYNMYRACKGLLE